mmetsp:Transcript_33855/g.83186  ORF Transcript_33855/g.83186 Transcript_33855/m.83186 type:complete len:218 (+) Transcript_33855:8800-9453(+)
MSAHDDVTALSSSVLPVSEMTGSTGCVVRVYWSMAELKAGAELRAGLFRSGTRLKISSLRRYLSPMGSVGHPKLKLKLGSDRGPILVKPEPPLMTSTLEILPQLALQVSVMPLLVVVCVAQPMPLLTGLRSTGLRSRSTPTMPLSYDSSLPMVLGVLLSFLTRLVPMANCASSKVMPVPGATLMNTLALTVRGASVCHSTTTSLSAPGQGVVWRTLA